MLVNSNSNENDRLCYLNVKFNSAQNIGQVTVIKTVKNSRLYNLLVCDELRYHFSLI